MFHVKHFKTACHQIKHIQYNFDRHIIFNHIKFMYKNKNKMFHVKHLVDIITKRWYTKSMQKTER
ncbi:hypothetical protein CLOHYLEM_06413 [[Clostridium] hylemonae DSM 15053]|uniref:Uncharacterized protein n=1 Tax=[Clostridium] hylemonae DSM 15053 TaxID=553973 RepID=C0C2V6_9FIRM|nr:hypothetical protein CLOHYLEM_06413 [[Clostridium] hylemonae DSM 15053]